MELQPISQIFKTSAKINKIIIYNNLEIEKYFNSFKRFFIVEKAAGGIVKNKEGELLCIFRNKHWDLPKGHIEEGETERETAEREVEEECGIGGLLVGDKIDYTFHIFQRGEEYVLKQTAWFAMQVDGIPQPKGQREEGIKTAIWKSKQDIFSDFEDTFPSIVDLIKVYYHS